MSISFVIVGWGLRTGDGLVRLFKCDSSGARVEIRRSIVLLNDDLDESEHFNWHKWNGADRLYAHIVDNLLSAANNTPESSVARQATVEYASQVLAINSELGNTDLKGETIILTAESILERLKTQKRENRSHFRVYSGWERRIQSMTSSMREQIKQKTISYLDELGFSPSVIKSVQNEIDEIETAFLMRYDLLVFGHRVVQFAT